MGNYSDEASSVRVDPFKESGKWYTTEAVKWTGEFSSGMIHDEFARALRDQLKKPEGGYRLDGMIAVCLKPYHQHAHPLMTNVADAVGR